MVVFFPFFVVFILSVTSSWPETKYKVVTFLALLLVSFDFCGWLMSLDLVIDEQIVKPNFSS